MAYNCKNYNDDGGDTTVIGGKLVIKEGAEVQGLAADPLQIASSETLGGIKIGSGLSINAQGVVSVNETPDAAADVKGLVNQGSAVADAAGEAPNATEFNALLASLRAAGIIASD